MKKNTISFKNPETQLNEYFGILKLWLSMVLLFISVASMAQTGRIKGKVTTSDDKPAEFSTVSLGVSQSTIVDKEGNYEFNDLNPGTYTITVSFLGQEPQKKEVELKQNQTLTTNFVLVANYNVLSEFLIVGDKYTVSSRKESPYVSKLPLKNMENPQVYNVVDIKLINEQMALSLEESFRNVPGAAPAKTGAGMPAFFSRGFKTSNNLRNGMATSQKTGIDLSIVERVETIKGPSSTLFGATMISFGGLVNYVTKKPYKDFGGEISYLQGSWDMSRITTDVNIPLNQNKTLLFRLNTAAQKENSFQDQGLGTTLVIAPSFSYQVNERLIFRLDADLQNYKGTSNTAWAIGNGVTATSYDQLPLDYKRSLIDNSFVGRQFSSNVFLEAEYKITDHWISKTNYSFGNGEYNDLYYFNQTWLNNDSVARAMGVFSPDKTGRKEIQQNFIGDFEFGSLRNRMVIGLDFMDQFRDMKYSYLRLDTVNVHQDTKDIRKQTVDNMLGNLSTPPRLTKSNTVSAFFSDVINFSDRLIVMISLRADRFDDKGTTWPLTQKNSGAYTQNALSPKLGLVFQPVKEKIALFGNYMNGFQNVGNVTQPDGSITEFRPQQANQWEGGVKIDLFNNNFNATFSYYDILVTNSIRPEKNDDGQTYSVQDGKQHSSGFEAEIIGNPIPGLNFIIGYGYNDNEYVKAEESLNGKRALGTPEHVGNIWISYSILKGIAKGVGIGAGAIYVSDAFYNNTNTFMLPSYTVFDATIFYNRPKYRISFKANNLTDEQYWISDGYFVRPQNPSQFLTSLAIKF